MGNNSMQLVSIEGIRIGETLITSQMLQADSQRWGNQTFLLGIGDGHLSLSDELALRILMFDTMPLTIVAEPGTVLAAEVIRLDRPSVTAPAFRVVLIPEAGSLQEISLNESRTVVVRHLRFTPGEASAVFGFVEVEIYFAPH